MMKSNILFSALSGNIRNVGTLHEEVLSTHKNVFAMTSVNFLVHT